jgi:L-fuconolactonase
MAGVPEKLHRNFTASEFAEGMAAAGVTGAVAVQAHPSEAESLWLVELGERFPFIKGVVASIELTDPALEETLARYREIPAICGVRHQQAEDEGPRWFVEPEVMRGFAAVEKSGLVYDFLCRAPQLACVSEVAKSFPGLRIVLEHTGKPPVAAHEYADWARALEPLHAAANVCCKLSELVIQADWSSWSVADFQPYVVHAAEVLGYRRLMWGGGWPICLLASSYQETIAVVLDNLPAATDAERSQVFRDNAIAWYGLAMS